MDSICYKVISGETTKVYEGIRRFGDSTNIAARIAIVEADDVDLWEVDGPEVEATLRLYYKDQDIHVDHITFLQPMGWVIPDEVILERAESARYEFAVVDDHFEGSLPVCDVVPLEDGQVAWVGGGKVIRFASPADAAKAERVVEGAMKHLEAVCTASVVQSLLDNREKLTPEALIDQLEEASPGIKQDFLESLKMREKMEALVPKNLPPDLTLLSPEE